MHCATILKNAHVSIVVCALQSHVTARIGIAAEVGNEDVSLVLERGQKVLCDNITFSGCRTPRSFHRSTAAMGGKSGRRLCVPVSPDTWTEGVVDEMGGENWSVLLSRMEMAKVRLHVGAAFLD